MSNTPENQNETAATPSSEIPALVSQLKIDIENLDGNNKKMTIEVPAAVVSAELLGHLRGIQRDAELKGFRKGKAPMDMIRKLYGDSATSRVTQNIVQQTLSEALRERDLTPITMPQIEANILIENAPFKYSATFEVSPPVDLKDYLGFKATKEDVSVSDEDITKTLDNVRAQIAEFQDLPEGTVAANGHFVSINYEGSEAGVDVPEASDKNGSFELGSNTLAPEFEAAIVGMKAGDDKNFSVKFPQPEKEEERTPVSGRTIDFHVKVTALKNRILPELSDEMAKKLGPFNGLEDLTARVREDLKREKEQKRHRELQEKAIDYLIAQNPVEAPQTLVNQQMEQLAVDAGMQLSQMGLDEAAIEERLKGWSEDMVGRATRQIQVSLLLSAIAKQEKIQAADDDIRQEITRIAAQARKNPKDVLEDFRERGLLGGLIRQVTEMKALDWVITKATA